MPKLTRQQIESIAQEAQRELSRRHLLEFTKYTYPQYEVGWHHKAYARKLDEFLHGNIKKLMIFMPPQHGKSELSSRRLPALKLGIDPDCRVGIIAYNHPIASKFNRDTQRIIESAEYARLFPHTRLSEGKKHAKYLKNADEFEIVGRSGSLVSTGVCGGLTSRTIDLLIMDDLYKDAATAWSSTVRESVKDWYLTVAATRLHNESQQLIVFTRWHEEDLAGYLLREEPGEWQTVIFPAIKIGEPSETDPRANGEALWASRHSLEKLLSVKRKSETVFDSLYQQNPTPKEGLLFTASEMRRFRLSDIKNAKPDAVISVCDTADDGDDNLCHVVGWLYGDEVYVVDVDFTQEPIEVTQPLVAEKLDRYNVSRAVFESNNGGKGYAQRVRELKRGRTDVTWLPTAKNKHTRIIMNSGIIKNNFRFLVDNEQSDEYRNYFYELTHYPKNGKVRHDDAADGTTMLAEQRINRDPDWGW